MISVWVLLIYMDPIGGGGGYDLSVVGTDKQSYQSYDDCQLARTRLEATLAKYHKWTPSRCDEVALPGSNAVIRRPGP
jgi:hypothetical protein